MCCPVCIQMADYFVRWWTRDYYGKYLPDCTGLCGGAYYVMWCVSQPRSTPRTPPMIVAPLPPFPPPHPNTHLHALTHLDVDRHTSHKHMGQLQ